MKRYMNWEAVIEGTLCLALSGLMLYMIFSGRYLLFVTPKMKPYLCFTAAILIIWAALRFRQAQKARYKVRLSKCLVLALPLMVMLLPYDTMASGIPKAQYTNMTGAGGFSGTGGLGGTNGHQPSDSSVSNTNGQQAGSADQDAAGDRQLFSSHQDNGVNRQSDNSGHSNSPKHYNGDIQQLYNFHQGQGASSPQRNGSGENGGKQPASATEKGRTSKSGLGTKVPSGLDDSNHTITVSDKDFYKWLVELSQHPQKYEGYHIKMHGTIFHAQTMSDDEFALTRLLMTCCVADLSDCGPICQWQGAADLEAGKWVDVMGTVHFDKTKGVEIKVEQIQAAQPATEQYVYPF